MKTPTSLIIAGEGLELSGLALQRPAQSRVPAETAFEGTRVHEVFAEIPVHMA